MSANTTRPSWSPAEDAIVRRQYPKGGAAAVRVAGRSANAVYRRALFLGLPNPTPLKSAWTSAEDRTLRKLYSKRGGFEAVLRSLPHRTRDSIQKRASRLRLRAPQFWTRRMDDLLRNGWGHEHLSALAKQLHVTEKAACCRAERIGLSLGRPQGLEYLQTAADRCGYHITTLRRILRWAGVRILPSYSTPSSASHRRRTRRHVVVPDDVDTAVAAYVRSETVKAAAEARGVEQSSLRRWLKDAGALGAKVAAARGTSLDHVRYLHWRIASDVIDRVIRERSMSEWLSDGARRVSVPVSSLADWLREAGHTNTSPKRAWRVLKATVDAVVADHRARTHGRAAA